MYKKWLLKALADLEHTYDVDVGGEYIGSVAASLCDQAASRAAAVGLHDLASRKFPVQVEFHDARSYLAECLNACPVAKRDVLTPPAIAKQIGVSRDTVLGWIHSGKLKAANLSRSSRPRYVVSPDDLQEFLRKRQGDAPQEKPRRRKGANDDVIEFF
jgi:excisionase family DNA binding protein